MNTEFSEPKLYTTGQELFPDLERLICEAKKEILVSVYEFTQDTIGKKFSKIFGEAARRGVRVRVLFDNVELLRDLNESIRENLQMLGVDAIIFRPLKSWLPWHPLMAACRNHVRLLLIDREIFGLGGMSFTGTSLARQDLFLLSRTEHASDIAEYFEKLCRLAFRPSLPQTLSMEKSAAALPGYTLLTSGPQRRDREIYRWLENAIRNAKKYIGIATPFFFPDRRILKHLAQASRRGVKIEIVTPLRTDKPRYDWFRAVPVPYLTRRGVLWHGSREYFHSKCCIVDNQWMFGSANIDIFGIERNYELNVCGNEKKMHDMLERHLVQLKKGAATITTQPTPLYIHILIILFSRLAEFILKLT
ncbi:MAG: phosphatidylserine/phosphatidylglycerophosphate/cardiolipin synthase family protein [bacterium]|nr:phosphatidylserine/phosphatidylglycerophosphate/cardiolipin synthase family protein [bacterium]